jgi:hypothetical protein
MTALRNCEHSGNKTGLARHLLIDKQRNTQLMLAPAPQVQGFFARLKL